MDSVTNTKRSRPTSDEEESVLESPANTPELKRQRRVSAEDYILNILDEEESAESQAIDGLASVMHSLEEELRSGAGSKSESTGTVAVPDQEPAGSVKELGYLLEASDDELGLPPAAEESPAITGDVVDLDDGGDVAQAATMYGHMWGFEDEIGFGSDFGFKPEMGDEGFGVIEYDEVGLFDHSEPSDLTWRTMPAV